MHGSDVSTLLREALGHHQAGRVRDATVLYNRILALDPANPDALHLLGLLAHQAGEHDRSVDLINRAIAINPHQPMYRNNLGVVLFALGRHSEAVARYRSALDTAPDYVDAHVNLGNAYQVLGLLEDAVDAFRKAASLAPEHIGALNNLGIALCRLGRQEEAVAAFRKGLAVVPDDLDLHRNLALALQELGRYEEALASCRKAVNAAPRDADALVNLGNVLQGLNRHEEAEDAYRRALALSPDNAAALNNLGNSLSALGRVSRSIEFYRRATFLDPENAEFHNNLGNALHRLQHHEEALQCFERVLTLDPSHANAFGLMAQIKRQTCDWKGLAEIDRSIVAQVEQVRMPIDPFTFMATADDPALQLSCARQFQETRRKTATPSLAARPPHGKLRIGYFTEMFRDHPLSHLIVQLIELHDRSRFDIRAFSYGPGDGSPVRRRLESAFDEFHDVARASDEEIAQLIRSSEIDILIDLNGYTERNRLQVLAQRPAPVQAHFLGYPGTSGTAFIDYLFVDDFLVPTERSQHSREKLIYLPECYPVNDRKRPIAEETLTRAAYGLPETGFVFCCFNHNYKITPAFFDVWTGLLRDIPGSVLWLLRSNDIAEWNLRQQAVTRDIDPERLIFAPRIALADHLARLKLADLFLDTLPVNAHTTASDALWAGLPVLTCAGKGFAARVAGSLLRAIGLPELVTETVGDYDELARRLAATPDLLRDVRAKLARNRTTAPLFDTERFRRHYEAACEEIWEIYQSGSPPRTFHVSPVAG